MSASTRTTGSEHRNTSESKQPASDEGISSESCLSTKHPPTRGIIVNLAVKSAEKFVEFIDNATGAKEYFRFVGESGKIAHLAVDVDGVTVYVAELGSDFDTDAMKETHVKLHLNCDDPLATEKNLLEAGATELIKCEQHSWGAMYGQYLDPLGQIWTISNSSSSTIHDLPEHLARKIIPFVSVRDAAAYMDFLSKAFGAEETYPASKDPTGKIMHAEMKLNGGLIMIGDHCGADTDRQEASVTITFGVATGKAMPLAKAFQTNGGEIVDEPSMQFWGQVWGRFRDPFGQMWGVSETKTGPTLTEEDMAVDLKIGAKYGWKYTWTVDDVPTMYCFGEVSTCPAKGPSIAQEMKAMIPLAFAGATKAGVTPLGPLVAAYFTWNSSEGGETSFTCGPTVAAGAPVPEKSGLGAREVGGCRCVTVIHMGPYDQLMVTYSATFEWIKAKKYESRMPVVEIYENNLKEVEPEKLRTKICIPIVSKESVPA